MENPFPLESSKGHQGTFVEKRKVWIGKPMFGVHNGGGGGWQAWDSEGSHSNLSPLQWASLGILLYSTRNNTMSLFLEPRGGNVEKKYVDTCMFGYLSCQSESEYQHRRQWRTINKQTNHQTWQLSVHQRKCLG